MESFKIYRMNSEINVSSTSDQIIKKGWAIFTTKQLLTAEVIDYVPGIFPELESLQPFSEGLFNIENIVQAFNDAGLVTIYDIVEYELSNKESRFYCLLSDNTLTQIKIKN